VDPLWPGTRPGGTRLTLFDHISPTKSEHAGPNPFLFHLHYFFIHSMAVRGSNQPVDHNIRHPRSNRLLLVAPAATPERHEHEWKWPAVRPVFLICNKQNPCFPSSNVVCIFPHNHHSPSPYIFIPPTSDFPCSS
jgi:hypothetical protein